ncbi:MAG: hypothetical protein ACREOA_04320 [Candidatus Dormibacteria bacterium]
MATLVALYAAPTIGTAELLAVSADPGLVALVVDSLLAAAKEPPSDPVLAALAAAERQVLELSAAAQSRRLGVDPDRRQG